MNDQITHSLRFKVTVGLLIPLTAILGVFSYLEYEGHHRLVMENLHTSAANAGKIVEGSLQHAMTTNDFAAVQQIVDDIARQPEVRNLLLLNKQGRVLLSVEGRATGTRMDLSDATCQACHRYKAAARDASIVLTNQPNGAILRNVSVIENKPECQECHANQDALLGVLISDFAMDRVESHLATFRRNRLVWAVGSIAVTLVVANIMISRFVLGWLEQFARAIGKVSGGDLNVQVSIQSSDEMGVLAQAFNRMTEGLREKQKLEQILQDRTQELQAHAEKLSTLNALAANVSQSLNLEAVLHSALDKVLELLKLRAGWIVLWDGQDENFRLGASQGLPAELIDVQARCAWQQCLCAEVFERGNPRVCYDASRNACPVTEYLQREGLAVRTCIPIRSKDRILGVMSLMGGPEHGLYGSARDWLQVLVAIGQQIGMAVENAQLYTELSRKETIRRQLLERLITVQEEERKRIALELHDQTSQPLASLMMTLEVLEKASSLTEVRAYVDDLQHMAADVLQQVHHLALELRPRLLDDLGLPAALRYYCREFEDRFRLPVDVQVLGLNDLRLASTVETSLYRIMQEALTNVARHAHARHVSVLLERRGDSVVLIVEDDGRGFDMAQVMQSRINGTHLGLYGMRERASLLGGTVTIESTPGVGTAIFVEIPLELARSGNEKDSPADR